MKNKKRSYVLVNVILLTVIAAIWASILTIYTVSNRHMEQVRKESKICEYTRQNEIEIKKKETEKMNVSKSEAKTNFKHVKSEKENIHKTEKQQEQKEEEIVKDTEIKTELKAEAKVETDNCNMEIMEEIEAEPDNYNNEKNYYNIVQTIGNVDPYYVNVVEEKLLTIPENIIRSFIENGWTIKVTTENIAEVYFYGEYSSVLAVTMRSQKMIIIEDREKAVNTSVEHEIGHYLATINGEVWLSEEFIQIYYEEVETFKCQISEPDTVMDECEFFAETFYYLIKDSSKCTPKAAEFIQRYMY